MKKLFVFAMCLLSVCTQAQTNYTINGTTYEAQAKSKTSSAIETGYTYKVGGKEYPIFLSKNGRAYIMRVSGKTGQEYKHYLGEEISRDLCNKLGVTYVEKK